MKYVTLSEKIYDLDDMNPVERYLINQMYEASLASSSFMSFDKEWRPLVTAKAKERRGEGWHHYSLLNIHKDLVGRIGIREGKLKKRRNLTKCLID